MSKSWAWLILCLFSITSAQSVLIPPRQGVCHAGDDLAWAAPPEPVGARSVLALRLAYRSMRRSGKDGDAFVAAAKQFGQKDDIIVLTLTFAPSEVLHA